MRLYRLFNTKVIFVNKLNENTIRTIFTINKIVIFSTIGIKSTIDNNNDRFVV